MRNLWVLFLLTKALFCQADQYCFSLIESIGKATQLPASVSGSQFDWKIKVAYQPTQQLAPALSDILSEKISQLATEKRPIKYLKILGGKRKTAQLKARLKIALYESIKNALDYAQSDLVISCKVFGNSAVIELADESGKFVNVPELGFSVRDLSAVLDDAQSHSEETDAIRTHRIEMGHAKPLTGGFGYAYIKKVTKAVLYKPNLDQSGVEIGTKMEMRFEF